MKKLVLLFTVLMISSWNLLAQTPLREISWEKIVFATPTFVTTNFGVCGSVGTKKFKISYSHCPDIVGVSCISGCGANPIRITMELQRNGVTIASQTSVAASDWANYFFYDVPAYPGTYRGFIKVERRKPLCIGWETVSTGFTNTITGSDVPATPNFNVNGTAIPSDGSPITTCISNIRLNAATSSCETRYHVTVQESDRWWNRTNDYEWGRWFSGQAPNNINLQSLSASNSVPPYYSGDPARQGQILLGGNLPSGQERYYRVAVCTNEPTWTCKYALIRVNPSCRLDPSTIIEDTNEYTWTENDPFGLEMNDENITIEVEATFDENNTDAFTDHMIPSINVAPNPFSTSTTIFIKNYDGTNPVSFQLYNSLGQCVVSMETNEVQFEVERNQLASGIYTYRATSNNELLGSGKLVIE